ncbi:hypothetical protein PHLCEN_2v6789 [Hermanssonia centrifuga]|uniref:Uncharacterized protein n=1 Tax=Hermanssonia centrifuga TaxID=98765 RepID=A0A2R6NYE7_9APHY|nr:hypothetical protein PHLCEN_2v6789 [Hermanssonia centrifuga]
MNRRSRRFARHLLRPVHFTLQVAGYHPCDRHDASDGTPETNVGTKRPPTRILPCNMGLQRRGYTDSCIRAGGKMWGEGRDIGGEEEGDARSYIYTWGLGESNTVCGGESSVWAGRIELGLRF